jgi:hypothetical protein
MQFDLFEKSYILRATFLKGFTEFFSKKIVNGEIVLILFLLKRAGVQNFFIADG